MTANRQPTADELHNVKQSTVQWDADAHRVYSVDGEGTKVYGKNSEGVFLRTENTSQETLLNDILKELKIVNMHLALLTDKIIKHEDI